MTVPKRSKIDWTDPCARWAELRRIYFEIVAGNKVASTSYTTNGVARSVSYSIHNVADLRREIADAQAECQQGKTGRRFAITAGHRRIR